MTLSESTRQKMAAAGFNPNVEKFSSEYQRWVRSQASSAAMRANGKKGYAATKAAGKEHIAADKAAEYRFNHPSDLEQMVINIMEWYDVPIDRRHREVKVGKFYVDFKYGDYVIEVNDDTWHTNDFHGDDRVSHDQGKYVHLREQGLTITILSEKIVRSGEVGQFIGDLMPRLREALQQEF